MGKLGGSSFSNFLAAGSLSLAAALSGALALLATPFLAKMYSPEAFGLLSIILSISQLVGSAASGRYEYAIPKESSTKKQINLVALIVALCVVSGIILTILFSIFGTWISALLQLPDYQQFLVLVGVSATLYAIILAAPHWFIHRNRLKPLIFGRPTHVAVRLIIQFSIAYFYLPTVTGLVIGFISGQLYFVIVIVISFLRDAERASLKEINKEEMIKVAKNYKELPQHTLSTRFVLNLTHAFFPIAVAVFFGSTAVGIVALANQLLFSPVEIIVRPLWNIMHSKLSKTENKAKLLITTLDWVGIIVGAVMIAFTLAFPLLLDFIGGKWSQFNDISPYFAMMVVLWGASESVSYFAAFGYYKLESIWTITSAVIRISSLFIASYYGDFIYAAKVYCICSSAIYLLQISFWGVISKNILPFLARFLVIILPAIILIFAIYLKIMTFKVSLLIAILWLIISSILAITHLRNQRM